MRVKEVNQTRMTYNRSRLLILIRNPINSSVLIVEQDGDLTHLNQEGTGRV